MALKDDDTKMCPKGHPLKLTIRTGGAQSVGPEVTSSYICQCDCCFRKLFTLCGVSWACPEDGCDYDVCFNCEPVTNAELEEIFMTTKETGSFVWSFLRFLNPTTAEYLAFEEESSSEILNIPILLMCLHDGNEAPKDRLIDITDKINEKAKEQMEENITEDKLMPIFCTKMDEYINALNTNDTNVEPVTYSFHDVWFLTTALGLRLKENTNEEPTMHALLDIGIEDRYGENGAFESNTNISKEVKFTYGSCEFK